MQASLGTGVVLLQAEHEAPVTALGVAPDGLSISIGTENGAVGCLDVVSHQYCTLLRSHTDSIHAVAVDPCRCNMLQNEHSMKCSPVDPVPGTRWRWLLPIRSSATACCCNLCHLAARLGQAGAMWNTMPAVVLPSHPACASTGS